MALSLIVVAARFVIVVYVFSAGIQSLPPHRCIDLHQTGDKNFSNKFMRIQGTRNEGDHRDSATVAVVPGLEELFQTRLGLSADAYSGPGFRLSPE
jgi:hypothetical protein